ncbi:hypothetical protein [Arenibacter sp. F20364]|nr:hypothetical protein [Arenibacter sp. F20364]MCK0190536.1 hypothetical protein [Arenibacter sp. F20364]
MLKKDLSFYTVKNINFDVPKNGGFLNQIGAEVAYFEALRKYHKGF